MTDEIWHNERVCRGTIAEQQRIIAELVSALESVNNEADEFDDHDGKLAHVKYATLVLEVRPAIERGRRP